MKTSDRETIQVRVGCHEIKLEATAEERRHIERAAARVTERLARLQTTASSAASPAKLATMVAFQFAFDLSAADEDLDEAQKLRTDLLAQKEASVRLQSLLHRVDEALAY